MTQPTTPEKHLVTTASPTPVVDVEGGAAKKQCWVKNKLIILIFRAVTLFFSLISFFLIVTVKDFTLYSNAINYVFAIVLMVMVYTVVFVGIHGHEVRTGEVVISPRVAVWMNALGDQILSLLLLSAGSSGGEAVSIARQVYVVDRTIEQLTASVAMAFITFLALEPAALISMYNLSVYILKS